MIQWFPGHIAKAERDLKEQLRAVRPAAACVQGRRSTVPPFPFGPGMLAARVLEFVRMGGCLPSDGRWLTYRGPLLHQVDIIFEVRDGRIPMSTRHPHVPKWAGAKPRLLLLNRTDMVPDADRAAWSAFFASRGRKAQWTDGNQGDGVQKVGRGKDGEGGTCAVGFPAEGWGGRGVCCWRRDGGLTEPVWERCAPGSTARGCVWAGSCTLPPSAAPRTTHLTPTQPPHPPAHSPPPHPNRRLSRQRWR